MRMSLFNSSGGFNPIEPGHVDIHDHDRRREPVDRLQHFFAALGLADHFNVAAIGGEVDPQARRIIAWSSTSNTRTVSSQWFMLPSSPPYTYIAVFMGDYLEK